MSHTLSLLSKLIMARLECYTDMTQPMALENGRHCNDQEDTYHAELSRLLEP